MNLLSLEKDILKVHSLLVGSEVTGIHPISITF
jgi:hypothetical protein